MYLKRGQGGREGRVTSLPAPTGGWNARDALTQMKPDQAVLLDNWFPEFTSVRLRRGYEEYATGVGAGDVETIMEYASGATSDLLAAGGGEIYNVTGGGAAVSLSSGYSSNRWQYINFGGHLLAVNGSDDPIKYDGSTVSANVITGSGLTQSDLIHITAHKSRVWLTEVNTLNAWYLATDAIAGAASKFDLAPNCRLGGYLMAIAPWTVDAGAGIDDFLCFITSEGEALVYQGTDPDDANAWALQGVFRIARPIGRRCTTKLAGELLILTESGAIPVSKMITTDRSIAKRIAITDLISGAFVEAARLYKANFGWQMTVYPTSNMLVTNIPVSSGLSYQYVMNTETGAWCRFTGMNAVSWCVLNDGLYFGDNGGNIFLADTGQNDDGTNIPADLQTSWQQIGGPINKEFTQVRPYLQSGQNPSLAIEMLADFEDRVPLSSAVSANTQAQWDVALWDVGVWGGEQIIADLVKVTAVGFWSSVRMRTATMGLSMKFIRYDVIFKPGGLIR